MEVGICSEPYADLISSLFIVFLQLKNKSGSCIAVELNVGWLTRIEC